MSAPQVGFDPDFDAVFDAAVAATKRAAESDSGPDGIAARKVLADLPGARDLMAEKMGKWAGKTYTAAAPPQTQAEVVRGDRTLVIPRPQGEPVWWDDPDQAAFLDHYILTRRALGDQIEGGLTINGPAGSGKTQSVKHAIDRINAKHGTSIRLLTMHCPTVTDPQKWFGRREVDEKGTRYETSDLVKAVEAGDYVIVLDDFTRLHPSIHNGIMSFLDGSNAVHLSDLNLTVMRHPTTVFIATANVGAQYGGTYRMDAAMRERFPYTIERPWPPADVEPLILTSRTGCDMDGATRLVAVAAESRRQHAQGTLRMPVSTRTLVFAAYLVASGMSEKEALSLTSLPMFDGDANGLAGAESDRARFAALMKGRLG